MVGKVDRSGKNAFRLSWQDMIWRYLNILGHMNTYFENFVIFSFMTFWAQNILIPPDQNVSIPLDQNVLVLLVSNTYNRNIQTFSYRKLCMKTWYSSKYLWILSIFLVWYFGPKLFRYPQIKYYGCQVLFIFDKSNLYWNLEMFYKTTSTIVFSFLLFW